LITFLPLLKFIMGTTGAQEPVKPVVNLSAEKIVQFGLVVKDVEKVAKRFSEVFGMSPWKFYDFKPKGIILHDKSLEDAECLIKVAIAHIGGRSFKLLQPISGPSTYMEFLQKYGEGFHYISLGTVLDHDKIVEALKKAGINSEYSATLGGVSVVNYLVMQEQMGGFQLEISKNK
jgi:methylmalonyl-CoA/ethylmalonyl-CoA epimerase